MKTSRIIAFVAKTLVIAVVAIWAIYDTPLSEFLEPSGMEVHGIVDVNIKYKDKKIFLMVELNKPLSCSNVIEILGVQQIVVKERTYTPDCKKINSKLMQITYTQVTEV